MYINILESRCIMKCRRKGILYRALVELKMIPWRFTAIFLLLTSRDRSFVLQFLGIDPLCYEDRSFMLPFQKICRNQLLTFGKHFKSTNATQNKPPPIPKKPYTTSSTSLDLFPTKNTPKSTNFTQEQRLSLTTP